METKPVKGGRGEGGERESGGEPMNSKLLPRNVLNCFFLPRPRLTHLGKRMKTQNTLLPTPSLYYKLAFLCDSKFFESSFLLVSRGSMLVCTSCQ